MSERLSWTCQCQHLILLMTPGRYKVFYKNRVQRLLGNAMVLRAEIQNDDVKSSMPSTPLDSRHFIMGGLEVLHLKENLQKTGFYL